MRVLGYLLYRRVAARWRLRVERTLPDVPSSDSSGAALAATLYQRHHSLWWFPLLVFYFCNYRMTYSGLVLPHSRSPMVPAVLVPLLALDVGSPAFVSREQKRLLLPTHFINTPCIYPLPRIALFL